MSETNGSGTSHYSLRGCFVDGLRQLVTVDKAMCFHMLKALIRSHDEGFSEGREDGIRYVMRAASDRRLEAHKVSGRRETKVSVMHAHIPRYAECEITFEHTVPRPAQEDTE